MVKSINKINNPVFFISNLLSLNNVHRLPSLISLIVVILLAIMSAQLLQSISNGFFVVSDIDRQEIVTKVALLDGQIVIPDFHLHEGTSYGVELARLHLMGEAGQVVNTIVTDVPETTLNLKLSGVIALGDGHGFAIIENNERKQKLYQINSEIIAGVILQSVFHDHVLISRSGLQEKLYFKQLENSVTQPLPSRRKAIQKFKLSHWSIITLWSVKH